MRLLGGRRKEQLWLCICISDGTCSFSVPTPLLVFRTHTGVPAQLTLRCDSFASNRRSSLSEFLDMKLVLEAPVPSSMSYMRALDSSLLPFLRAFAFSLTHFPTLTPEPLRPKKPFLPWFCVRSFSRSSSESSMSWSFWDSSPDGLPL